MVKVPNMSERDRLLSGWIDAVKQGKERELWGQVVEAADLYGRSVGSPSKH